MKLFSLQLVTVVFIIIFFNACKDKEQANLNTVNNNSKTSIKYAKGFEIQQFKDFKKLNSEEQLGFTKSIRNRVLTLLYKSKWKVNINDKFYS